MSVMTRELALAEQLQEYILGSGLAHHFKITNDAIVVNFRNPPSEETINLLKLWDFVLVVGHLKRKYIRRLPTTAKTEVS